MKNSLNSSRIVASLTVLLTPRWANAHHAMDGALPGTFADGLLSGLAHPVIGVDHLALLLLVGAYSGTTRLGTGPLAAFVAATLLGCLVHVARLDLPQVETGIASSLVVMGVAACFLTKPARAVTALVLWCVGLLHGYAYGESIVGAEPTPLLAYLLGLSVVQFILGALVFRLSTPKADMPADRLRTVGVQILGLANVLVGAVVLAEALIGPI